MRRAGVRWGLILSAIVLHGLPWLQSTLRGPHLPPTFELPSRTASADALPVFTEELIGPEGLWPSYHVASIAELPGGRLAAIWYAGSREGATDVAICFATHDPEASTWSRPRPILTPALAEHELGRAIRKVGNPVIFSDATGKLWLLYVTITVGGWSGSSLNLTTSDDAGQSWTPSRRLALSPFFNLSELVRNRPAPLSGGGWAVPIYHELYGKFAEVLWLRTTGTELLATKSRINGGRSGFQPTLAPLTTNTALVFLRDCSPRKRISVARTDDAGRSWSAPDALDLPNPGSGLASLRLADGRVLLAFNDAPFGRSNLRLAASEDDGRTWKRLATLADEPRAEFSYPYLLQTRDGTIHLVYTWKRKGIKHVAFNAAWLDAQKGTVPR